MYYYVSMVRYGISQYKITIIKSKNSIFFISLGHFFQITYFLRSIYVPYKYTDRAYLKILYSYHTLFYTVVYGAYSLCKIELGVL